MWTIKRYLDTKPEIYVALLQIRSTLLGPGLPRPAMLLFNHLIRGIIPIINKPLVNSNSDDEHYEVLLNRQIMIRIMIPPEIMLLLN